MKTRAVVTVRGDVQSVGYREYVREKALLRGLTGIVANIPDGTVLVIVDGDPEEIGKFISDIQNPMPPATVRNITREFREPDSIFQDFYVARDLEKNGDLSAKGEIMIRYIQLILSEIQGTTTGIAKLDNGVNSMDRHIGEHFDRLDKKYDTFGNKLDRISDEMKAMRELLTVFVEHLMKRGNAEA